MAVEDAADGTGFDVPDLSRSRFVSMECALLWVGERDGGTYPDLLIFGTCGEVFTIGAKTYAPNIEVPVLRGCLVD